MSAFTKAGLQTLAATYEGGTSQCSDEHGAFQYLLGESPSLPKMAVLKWDVTMLLCNMVMIIDPETPNALLLRVVLTPEFAWLGVHFAGALPAVSIASLADGIAEIVSTRPLIAEAHLGKHLDFGAQWAPMMEALVAHFNSGNVANSAGQEAGACSTEDGHDAMDEAADFGSAAPDSMVTYSEEMEAEMQVPVHVNTKAVAQPVVQERNAFAGIHPARLAALNRPLEDVSPPRRHYEASPSPEAQPRRSGRSYR